MRLMCGIVTLAFVLLTPALVNLGVSIDASQTGQVFVWEKTSPCLDGRQEWFTVAASYPGEVGSASRWQRTDFPGGTFAAAAAEADKRKLGQGFENRCCRQWSVLRNTTTGALSVQKTAQPNPIPFGFVVNQSGLCCEEAMNRAGLPVGTQDCRNVRLSTGQIVHAAQSTSTGSLAAGKSRFVGTFNSVWGNGHVEPPWTRAVVFIELTADGRYLVEPAIPCRPPTGQTGRPVPGAGGDSPIQATEVSKAPLTLKVTCESPQRAIRTITLKLEGDVLAYEETASDGGRASFKGTRTR